MTLEVGRWYWMIGHGPMQILELPDPTAPPYESVRFQRRKWRSTVTLRVYGSTLIYWATPADLLPLHPTLWENYRVQYEARLGPLREDKEFHL